MKAAYHLFERYGIELEYMLVHRESLDVLPLSDEILKSAAGRYTNEFYNGKISWSNEFMLHVIELKNSDPTSRLPGLRTAFNKNISCINGMLKQFDGRLMPSAMHPWMSPETETRLWPHRNRHIYTTYDRIFDCRRHGWANLQSMHINIAFHGDSEFSRLHAAVRLLMPLIPAISASSPVSDSMLTGKQDTRLLHYGANQKKVPSITGQVIPEPVYRKSDYRKKIFERIYKGISRYDREGILNHEWLNSRGAIPRYERNALEIRLVDVQETPAADLAVAGMIISVLKALAEEKWTCFDEQAVWKTDRLAALLDTVIESADRAAVSDRDYLRMFGFRGRKATAMEVWHHFLDEVTVSGKLIDDELHKTLRAIMQYGPLSRRITRAIGNFPSKGRLREVYGDLCDCLSEGKLFLAN